MRLRTVSFFFSSRLPNGETQETCIHETERVLSFLGKTAAALASSEKMLFTCRNKTTNKIVVMPKRSRAIMDQTVFRKMLGVNACKVVKFKTTDNWRLVKLPFTTFLEPLNDVNDDSVFLDLPRDAFPVLELETVLSPFKYLDRREDATTIQSNTIE